MTFCVNSPIRIITTLLMLNEIQIFSNYKNYIKDIYKKHLLTKCRSRTQQTTANDYFVKIVIKRQQHDKGSG